MEDETRKEACALTLRYHETDYLAIVASGKYSKDTITAVSERHQQSHLRTLGLIIGQEIDEEVIKAQRYDTARSRYKEVTGFDIDSPEFAKIDAQLAQALLDE